MQKNFKTLCIILPSLLLLAACNTGRIKEQLLIQKAMEVNAKGNDSGAIAILDAVIKMDDANVTAYHERGTIKANRKDYPGAVADLSKAISLYPRYLDAYVERSRVYKLTGQTAQSLADEQMVQRLRR